MKMKRLLSFALSLVLVLGSASALPSGVFDESTSITASADFEGDWEYFDNGDGTICITSYLGGDTQVTIPSELGGKEVSAIGDYAFQRNHTLESVTIPGCVLSIGWSAFDDCVNLKSVKLENGVQVIGDYAFDYCESLESIDLPSSVWSIGAGAFAGCGELKSINIHESVDYVGKNAFEGTKWLEQKLKNDPLVVVNGVLIAQNVKTASVTIPEGVIVISDGAFFENDYIKNVKLPDGVTRIGNEAFRECDNLTSINIPESVGDIGENAFTLCRNLASITLPEGLYNLGNEAFDSCTNLKTVTIPESLEYVADRAFRACYRLKNVTFKSGVVRIGNEAFADCEALTSVTLPDTLEEIYADAFARCVNLQKVVIPQKLTKLDAEAFEGTPWLENELDKEPPLLIANNRVYYGKRCTGSVVIPDGVTAISMNSFSWCDGIEKVTIPNGVTSIDPASFQGCQSLSEVNIPASVDAVGDYAFSDCRNLTDLTIDEGVEAIYGYAFSECDSLKSITIPKSVKYIGEYAFGYDTYADYTTNDPYTPKRIDGVKIFCYKNSAGEKYAKDNDFDYILLDVEHVKAKKATCTEDGTIEYWIYGGKFYSDAAATKEIAKESIFVKATGHQFGEWKQTKAPSCTKKGEQIRECKACDLTETKIVDALGHDYIDTVVAPTCTQRGYTNHKCSRCNDEYQDNVTEVIAHTFSEWSVTKKPTCTEKGIESRKCEKCNETETRNIDALGHTWSDWKTTAFDVAKGTSTQTRTCSVCNKTETKTTKNAIQRLAGSGRYETAVEISKAGFPDGSDTVVLAYGLNYADALAGVSLAKAKNAPILLTNLKTLPAETLAEIKRLKAKNVIILGGTGAVGAEVEKTLKNNNLDVERIAGATRFETATKIAQKMQVLNDNKAPEEIFFVYAFNSADALSVSAVAAVKGAPVIYLKTTGDLDDATAAYLKSIKGSVKNAYVIGGEGVISKDMMKKTRNALGVTPVRVFGANRFETCVAVNNRFADVLDGDMLCVATGMDFPDALAGGVYAALNKAPLFLINGKAKTPQLSDEQKAYLKTKAADKITAFGGVGVVPDNHIADIAKNSV